MKLFSAADRRTPLDLKTARSCLIVNQFATPGLGSLLGRRFVAGTGQLIVATLGFCLVMLWFLSMFRSMYSEITSGGAVAVHNEYGKFGALLFLAAWLWSWVTSLSLVREAKRNEPPKV